MSVFVFDVSQVAGMVAARRGSKVIVAGRSSESARAIVDGIVGALGGGKVRGGAGNERVVLRDGTEIRWVGERVDGMRGRTASLLIIEHGVPTDRVRTLQPALQATNGAQVRATLGEAAPAPQADPHEDPEPTTNTANPQGGQ